MSATHDRSGCSEQRSVWFWLCLIGSIGLLGLIVYPLDATLSQTLSDTSFWPGDVRRVFKFSECFAHGSGILIILIAVWMLAPTARMYVPRIMGCALGGGMVANLVKLCVARRRPMVMDDHVESAHSTWASNWPSSLPATENYFDYGWQSFPSGHAATAAGLAFGLSWVFPRGRWLFVGLAVLASIQRIESLAHWPSDVLAGAMIGTIMGILFTVAGAPGDRLVTRLENRLEKRLSETADVAANKPANRKAA